jgi:hypothetical protein
MDDGTKIDADCFKFTSWSIRRIIHSAFGRKFGTLELDEQLGTAIHAVIAPKQSDSGILLRVGAAAGGGAWRAIRDIARNLNVTDLEVSTDYTVPDPEPRVQRGTIDQVSDKVDK